MPFVIRKLSESEAAMINLGGTGVEQRRLPVGRTDWTYAFDDSRSLLFTQLVSAGWEMRDGLYYYLLRLRARAFVFELTPSVGMSLVRWMGESPRTQDERAQLTAIANEAYDAISSRAV